MQQLLPLQQLLQQASNDWGATEEQRPNQRHAEREELHTRTAREAAPLRNEKGPSLAVSPASRDLATARISRQTRPLPRPPPNPPTETPHSHSHVHSHTPTR